MAAALSKPDARLALSCTEVLRPSAELKAALRAIEASCAAAFAILSAASDMMSSCDAAADFAATIVELTRAVFRSKSNSLMLSSASVVNASLEYCAIKELETVAI